MINGSQRSQMRILTASAEVSALSLPSPNTQQWSEGSFHCTSIVLGQPYIHPSASTPPSPCPCSPTAIITPLPKTFTSSFPVQNPKLIVRSYLKPFTAGTNKTLLAEPSLAVYKQDTKSSVTLPQEAQGLLNMPGALCGQARGA